MFYNIRYIDFLTLICEKNDHSYIATLCFALQLLCFLDQLFPDMLLDLSDILQVSVAPD